MRSRWSLPLCLALLLPLEHTRQKERGEDDSTTVAPTARRTHTSDANLPRGFGGVCRDDEWLYRLVKKSILPTWALTIFSERLVIFTNIWQGMTIMSMISRTSDRFSHKKLAKPFVSSQIIGQTILAFLQSTITYSSRL